MVDPITEDERMRFKRKLKLGLTTLVGLSAGLVTSQTDPTTVEAAGAVAAGLVVGYALAWFVVPSGLSPAARQQQRLEGSENPFADGGDLDDRDREDGERSE